MNKILRSARLFCVPVAMGKAVRVDTNLNVSISYSSSCFNVCVACRWLYGVFPIPKHDGLIGSLYAI